MFEIVNGSKTSFAISQHNHISLYLGAFYLSGLGVVILAGMCFNMWHCILAACSLLFSAYVYRMTTTYGTDLKEADCTIQLSLDQSSFRGQRATATPVSESRATTYEKEMVLVSSESATTGVYSELVTMEDCCGSANNILARSTKESSKSAESSHVNEVVATVFGASGGSSKARRRRKRSQRVGGANSVAAISTAPACSAAKAVGEAWGASKGEEGCWTLAGR
jgi:hypothetical protein